MKAALTCSQRDITSSMAPQKSNAKRLEPLHDGKESRNTEWRGKIAIKERFKRCNKTIQENSEVKLHSRQSRAACRAHSYCSAINNSTSKNSSGAALRKNCTELTPRPPYLIKRILLFVRECNKNCHSSGVPAIFCKHI